VNAISVTDLRKSYGRPRGAARHRLRDRGGRGLRLLGPNGAGKTTTVEILEGYRTRDGGEVRCSATTRSGRSARSASASASSCSTPSCGRTSRSRETLRVFAGYYDAPRDVRRRIALVGLEEKRDQRVKTLSGGQKRRLDLGSPCRRPGARVLDEPTTGFDPQAARAPWT
jgi:ABC-2 type transport system ATP-binding protein